MGRADIENGSALRPNDQVVELVDTRVSEARAHHSGVRVRLPPWSLLSSRCNGLHASLRSWRHQVRRLAGMLQNLAGEAQQVERRFRKAMAVGSIPTVGFVFDNLLSFVPM